MQDNSRSNKIKNKEEISAGKNLNEAIEKGKSQVAPKNNLTAKKEKNANGTTRKKAVSKETTSLAAVENVNKIEEKEINTKNVEKEINAKNTEKKVEKKPKESTRKTTAKRTAVKKSVTNNLQSSQKNEAEIQNSKIDKGKKDTSVKKENEIVQKDIETTVTTDKKSAVSRKVQTTKKSTARKPSKSKNKTIAATKEEGKQSKLEQTKNTVKKIVEKVDKAEITNFNTYLFHQGKNYEAYNILGAHIKREKTEEGIQFATWAPNAKEVYVVGDFNDFEVRDSFKLERINETGLWKGFFTDVKAGDRYKYCIVDQNGERGEYKADPYGIQTELRPDNASIIYIPKNFLWKDKKWIDKRNKINVLEQALNIYEIHLGSWKTNKDGGFLSYEEIAEILPKYVKEMGYTHVEIMPLVEHPLDASWGYQGTGYYSPTSRYGSMEGLKTLINKLHEVNIGVVMDWVPGHFCKDAHGLYKFDGTPTYEYQEEWRAENKGWGTCNFDLGRPEVKSYLISNALYWYREFHIDGLRVDAVSSILYLDYSRSEGEWVPNKYGDKGNLEAIDFLKELNKAVFEEYPTALMIAEESTAWPNVTKSPKHDGLGFNFKWNMGWMNDTLEYVQIDPKYRKNNHNNITFSMMYNYAENYLLPLSHDEVVHGKKSLVDKMWGDEWNKFAGLRSFMGYMMGHPGKKLVFMGCEFGQRIEWREYSELEWNSIEELEIHKKTQLFFKDLNNLYLNNKAFWELDHDYKGFNWIEADNNEQSVLIFARRSRNDEDTLVFVINFTSTVYYDYRIGVPFLGTYEELFNTDDERYGGSGQIMGEELEAEKIPFHNQPYSLMIKVPPMAALVLKVKDIKTIKEVSENDDELE